LIDIGALSGESGTGSYGVDVLRGTVPGAPIPAANVHPMPTSEAIAGNRDADWCAAQYAEMLRAGGPPLENGWPVFDVALLGVGPDGHILSVNNRYLILDGKRWLPVMGEFHSTRYPERYWEEEILKMKAGGVQIIATYVFWIHHEEVEGQFDWSGQAQSAQVRGTLRQAWSLCVPANRGFEGAR